MVSKMPSFTNPCSELEAVTFIQQTIKILEKIQENDDINIVKILFENLNKSFYELEDHRSAISNELLKTNFVTLSSKIIYKCHKQGFFSNNDVWNLTIYAISSLWNFSDKNQEISHKILCSDLPKLLVSNVLNKSYTDNLQDLPKYFLINSFINVIHNIARYFSIGHIDKLDEFKLELVALIKRDNSDVLGISSILTLACLVNETELTLLDEVENSIKILIKEIELTLANENKSNVQVSVWEFLNCLDRISVNDKLKQTILNENGILTITKILDSPNSDVDVEKCLSILWNLSFNEDVKALLIEKFNLMSVVKRFENHKSPKIRKCCEGILWSINDESKKRNLKSIFKKDIKFDLFISHCWTNKEIVSKIVDKLKILNINFWIDKDQMRGSILETISAGIERSKIVLIFISKAYFHSPSCRLEAEYAVLQKKTIIPVIVEYKYKPTGWLGIIMGMKTYYEFSERRNFTETFKELMKEINSISSNQEETTIEKKINKLDFTDFEENNNKTKSRTTLSFKNWSSKDVEDWLMKNDLGRVKSYFTNINGKLLYSMIDMHSKSPQFLYEQMEKKFGMDIFDILIFKNAIEELAS